MSWEMLISDLKIYFPKRPGNQDCLAEKLISSWEHPTLCAMAQMSKPMRTRLLTTCATPNNVISYLKQLGPYTPIITTAT